MIQIFFGPKINGGGPKFLLIYNSAGSKILLEQNFFRMQNFSEQKQGQRFYFNLNSFELFPRFLTFMMVLKFELGMIKGLQMENY